MLEPIYYRELGEGTPLVLVHGDFNDGMTAWPRQLDTLSTHHRLIIPDRRGSGRSPVEPRPYTIAGDAADVLDVIERAKIRDFHLLGHSYGGLVALGIVKKSSNRVRSLHLIEPPYMSLLPEEPHVRQMRACGRKIKAEGATWSAELVARTFFAEIAGESGLIRMQESRGWPAIVREAQRYVQAEDPADYPAGVIAELRLEGPVIVYSGGRSNPGLQCLAQRVTELLPNARLIEIPKGNHGVQFTGAPFNEELLRVTRSVDNQIIAKGIE